MCDTLAVVSPALTGGKTLFAKSSDREPNEAHELVLVEAGDHTAGQPLKCTYITVPQVSHTYRALLAKPYQIWGAEMGVNEHGVAIGNEAVFTRMPYEKGPGLTGMDMLRLALERSDSASHAVDVITALLEKYGQGGNCGYRSPMFYHNSFLIVDFHSAWILETAGKQWAARQVRNVGSISNALSIGTDWDRSSAGLVSEAENRGWAKHGEKFDFSASYSDFLYTTFSAGRSRQKCTSASLHSAAKIESSDLMAFLRQHPTAEAGEWRPDRAIAGADVCMHAGFGPIRIDQTAGSLVVELENGQITAWATGTSLPCVSIFKPLWLDAMPAMERPGEKFDPNVLWWRHERLQRAIHEDYPTRAPVYIERTKGLEESFITGAQAMKGTPAEERRQFSQECLRLAAEAEDEVYKKISQLPLNSRNRFYYQMAWNGFNRDAGLLA